MRSHTEPDLLTRIQEKHACSRSAARRILQDLIDHHKRLSLRSITGTDISHGKGLRKVFSAPISSKSTTRYPYRRQSVQNVGEHPHKRTRSTDLDPISSKMATITFEHPENGEIDHNSRPLRYLHPTEPVQPSKYIQIYDTLLPKRDFIETCSQYGMTNGEIARFLMNFIPSKPAELPTEHYKRIYQQVYWATKRS